MNTGAYPVAKLKPGREKPVLNRHPWVFSGSIADLEGQPKPGGIVDVHDHRGQFLARGYINVRSQITIRLLTWRDEAITSSFWRAKLKQALARRECLAADEDTDAYRLIFAESDGLPGLIVDCYGDWLVLQSLTVGIERIKDELAQTLMALTSPQGIYERSDADVRHREGLGSMTGAMVGEPPAELIIRENALRFLVDLREGHKTGLYLDQRENRAKAARYCAGGRVLNAFSYTGGFGLYAAQAGATQVVNLDTSDRALALARRNFGLNDLPLENVQDIAGDAFEELRSLRDAGRRFDVVVLDPPKFAFSQAQVRSATRGYKDVNMLGMNLLRSGGYLVTFSCSGAVSEDLFQKVLFGASVDVGRQVRILERLSQGADHPVLLTFPEGAYLKGFICRVE